VGRTNSARARATRIRHPPDMSFVLFAIILLEKPSPWRSSAARLCVGTWAKVVSFHCTFTKELLGGSIAF
jgi:hypothetical protein